MASSVANISERNKAGTDEQLELREVALGEKLTGPRGPRIGGSTSTWPWPQVAVEASMEQRSFSSDSDTGRKIISATFTSSSMDGSERGPFCSRYLAFSASNCVQPGLIAGRGEASVESVP